MNYVGDEHLVLSALLKNTNEYKEYFTKVIPHIKEEYFTDNTGSTIFKLIKKFSQKYNQIPDYTTVRNIISTMKAPEDDIKKTLSFVDEIESTEVTKNVEYLTEKTEKFCQERALYRAIFTAYSVYDGEEKNIAVGALPELIKKAISVSFNTDIGHDYDLDYEKRWEYYSNPLMKNPFEYEILNAITGGGCPKKTLNIIAAGVNVGKTLMLVILASMYKRLGYDVLYITNEVAELELGARMDASILGVDTDALPFLTHKKFLQRVVDMQKGTGKLIIHEFPTGTGDANKLRSLLQELKLKKNFKPTVLINDYITLFNSISVKNTGNIGEYYLKVAEEQRAVAVEYDLIYWSAAQLTTDAMGSTDPVLADLASSQGIARTADLVWAAVRTDLLDAEGKIMMKQLKTRYHKVKIVRWEMGIDVGKHRMRELEKYDIKGVTDSYKPRKPTVNKSDVIPDNINNLLSDKPNDDTFIDKKMTHTYGGKKLLNFDDDTDSKESYEDDSYAQYLNG